MQYWRALTQRVHTSNHAVERLRRGLNRSPSVLRAIDRAGPIQRDGVRSR